MNKLTDRKKINALIFLCTIAYFISYVSRINLGAVMVELVQSGFSPKATAAMAITLCSITYGIGQVISGYLGDKFKPQNIMFTGFLITGAMNLCVSVLQNSSLLLPLWSINGFAQALMWPPLVKIMSAFLSDEDYERACVRVSWGSSFGTIAVYLFSPVIINILNFRYVFAISAVLALGMAAVWKICFTKKYEPIGAVLENTKKASAVYNEKFGASAIGMIVIVMLCITIQGSLRDGITNWMPSYISDTFNLGSEISILTGCILPVFGLICINLSSFIHTKSINNEMTCSGVFFMVCALSSLLLALNGGKNPFISTLLMALSSGCMHGVNMLLICIVPAYFAKYGRVSLISGVLNSCTYLGSAVSAYGISFLSDNFGWSATAALWAACALLGGVICISTAKMWRKFK